MTGRCWGLAYPYLFRPCIFCFSSPCRTCSSSSQRHYAAFSPVSFIHLSFNFRAAAAYPPVITTFCWVVPISPCNSVNSVKSHRLPSRDISAAWGIMARSVSVQSPGVPYWDLDRLYIYLSEVHIWSGHFPGSYINGSLPGFFVQQMALEEYTNLARQINQTLLLYSLAIFAVFLLVFQLQKTLITRTKVKGWAILSYYILITSQLKAIPTVGSSGIITSWIDAFKFVHHAKEIVQEGHKMVCIGSSPCAVN